MADEVGGTPDLFLLNVAGFLSFAAAYGDQPEPQSLTVQHAVAIARAYLGEESA